MDCACVYAVFKQATLCFGLYCVGAQTKFGLFAFVALFVVFFFEVAADDACTPLPIYFGSFWFRVGTCYV